MCIRYLSDNTVILSLDCFFQFQTAHVVGTVTVIQYVQIQIQVVI